MTKQEVPEFDFDNFDEDAAIADEAKDIVRVVFGGGVFAGKFRDGTVVHLPLDIPSRLVEDLDIEGKTAVQQLEALLDAMGLKDRAQKVLDQGVISSVVFAQKFFDAIEKITGAALGK